MLRLDIGPQCYRSEKISRGGQLFQNLELWMKKLALLTKENHIFFYSLYQEDGVVDLEKNSVRYNCPFFMN